MTTNSKTMPEVGCKVEQAPYERMEVDIQGQDPQEGLTVDYVEYYEYDCWNCCTENGCPGHLTDIPISITINGITFYVEGAEGGDYPLEYSTEALQQVRSVVNALQESIEGTKSKKNETP